MKFYTLKKPRLNPLGIGGHQEDPGCPDASWKPLSRNQKTRLVLLAKAAAEAAGVPPAGVDPWRHDLAIRACGRRISEATQHHWPDLKAAFQAAAGDSAGALRTHLRSADNKRRIALHKLTAALATKGLPISYAAAICRTQYKCAIEDASAKQLWCLFYTVTNRRKS